MGPKNNVKLYTITEEAFLRYLLKIDIDKTILTNVLFEEGKKPPQDILVNLCEYFVVTISLEDILNDIDSPDFFNEKQKCYYVTDEIVARFSMMLEALVTLKQMLSRKGFSISLH